jgi:hypothetical protein
MVRESRDPRSRQSARLVAAALLLCALPVGAQIVTELSDSTLAVGERLTYTLTIDHEETSDVTLGEFEFPGLRLVEGPAIRPVSILGQIERSRAIEVRYTYEAASPGRYLLEPQALVVAGQEYWTAERLVQIGERNNRSRIPHLSRWVCSVERFVVGQAAPVYLEVFNTTEYGYPSSLQVPVPATAIMEEVTGLGSVGQREVDGIELLTIPVAVFMLTPSSEGQVTLPEVTVTIGDLHSTAAALSIPVDPAPARVAATGAVGSFRATADVDRSELAIGERATVTIRVEGTGNLHLLTIPHLELEGFRVDTEERTTSWIATDSGYQGFVEQRSVIRPERSPTYRITIDPFLAYNPAADMVRRTTLAVAVPSVAELRQPPSDDQTAVQSALLDSEGIRALERRNWFSRAIYYGWLVPGLLFFIVRRIWKRQNGVAVLLVAAALALFTGARGDGLPWEPIERGNRRYAESNLPMAVHAYEEASRRAPDSAGIQHNLAILYFQSRDTPRAVYAAREAIRLVPGSSALRTTLARIETAAGLERTLPPLHRVHPDLFFAILAAAVNALFVAAALAKRPWKGVIIIGQILLIVVVLSSCAGLVVSARRHGEQLGVMRSEYLLRRIPSEDSDGWLALAAGTAVEVVAQQGSMVLVRNVLGLEGWVEETQLLWPGNPAIELLRYRAYLL